jgi:5-methylthioadenosine/S-adenosylhomocysteine deaminase
LTTIGLGPHSIYGCALPTLNKLNSLAKKFNLVKHIHMNETKQEVEDSIKTHQMRPVELLKAIDFLDENTLLVHSVHLNENELKLVKERNSKLVHCPTSNLKLASGIMPLIEAWKLGITVGLGTDSVASNNCMDMFGEMKICAITHKNHH